MIDEILVRCFTPQLIELQTKICDLIRSETESSVSAIDHSEITLDDFEIAYCDDVWCNPTIIALDKVLARKFNIPYLKISRVFDLAGNVCERVIRIPNKFISNTDAHVCIIDTDVATGETMKIAERIVGACGHSVLIKLTSTQDLIDIEDLVFDDSLLLGGDTCSYLVNEEFFARRTSLPGWIYQPICELVQQNMTARSMFI